MKPTSQTGDQTGFTLLELLLAMTLGTVVLSAVYGSYSVAINAQQRITRTATELQSWRFFSERLRADLKNVHLESLSLSSSLMGGSDKLTFQHTTHLHTPAYILYEITTPASGTQLRRITMSDKRRTSSGNSGTIILANGTVLDHVENQKEQSSTILISDAEHLSFQYLIDGKWSNTSGKTLPNAVRCIVVVDGRQQMIVVALEVGHLQSR